jgi:hypothetical protein
MPLLFYSQERNSVHIKQEAGWASGLVWVGRENSPLLEFKPWAVHPLMSYYTHYAIVATIDCVEHEKGTRVT